MAEFNSEFPSNVIDRYEMELPNLVDSSLKITEIAKDPIPILQAASLEALNEKDKTAFKVHKVISKAWEFFDRDGDFPLRLGLISIDAKLGDSDVVLGNKNVRFVSFIRQYRKIIELSDNNNAANDLINLLGRLRGIGLARQYLETKGHSLFPHDGDILKEFENDPKYLEEGMQELVANKYEKYRQIRNFIMTSADILELANDVIIDGALTTTAETVNESDDIPPKETLLDDNIDDLNTCLENSQKIMLLMISAPYVDELPDDLSDMSGKKLAAYEASQAYHSLEKIFRPRLSQDFNYAFDRGLRAMDTILGDPKFHGPKYDNQFATFMLRIDNLIKSNLPNIKDRIKNIAIYMRAAKLASSGNFFESATEIANKVKQNPSYLRQAKKELEAYDGIAFEDLYAILKSTTNIMGESLKKIDENPDWLDLNS